MTSPGPDLSGRSAIVTGSNQGLGLAIAERFLASGANVLLMARDAVKLDLVRAELASRARPGQTIHALPGDVSRPEDCAAAVAEALKHFGGLTVLVNNAGVYGPMGRLEDVDWAEWEEAIRINLVGTALMCRAALRPMRARGYGKIVNLSGGGATGPLPRFSAYAASKAAVVRLTETLAEEVRDDHIDVNAIAPGALNTRLLDQVLEAGPDKVGREFHARALKQKDEGGAPLEKGAALAAFLASARSDGITGRLLSAVWDDWERLADRRAELEGSDVYTLRRIVPKDRGPGS
jgi:NAD(P)-dependent dehydrogenase (short-subunit alcohol dehydrogenase family)